jgi:hypothetical protein
VIKGNNIMNNVNGRGNQRLLISRGGLMADAEQDVLTANSISEGPTPHSIWQAMVGTPITDEFLNWPADLFALTHVILERSEAYRFVLSPPPGAEWPPTRFSSAWADAVEESARQWSAWIEDRTLAFPTLLADEWNVFRDRAGITLDDLADGRDWEMCEALLTLHAIADEACAGLGLSLDRSDGRASAYRAHGRELLARTGSLARIPTHFLRVLPKVRTRTDGTSLRSFSRYACVLSRGVDVRWHKVPVRRSGTGPEVRHANLLLLPWPLRVRESDFRPIEGSVQRLSKYPFGFFEFAPSEKLDLDLVERLLVSAREEVDSVDVVMLPECAVEESEIPALEALLGRYGVAMLGTGVRQQSQQPGRLSSNWVHMGINPNLEKGASLPDYANGEWFHIRQNKHHRWSLDERQVLQYHLGGALHPHIRWWEATDIPRRGVQFSELGDDIILVSLVCEDLAQIDDVAEVIRSVGPTVVYTPLLDGPQLSSRWAARYASVLADDPGAAVLTLTSYGMVQRSRPNGRELSPVVALWKDPVRGFREIPLENGAQGVLLTVCGDLTTRSSADGRHPIDNMTEYFDVAVYQVRANTAVAPSFRAESKTADKRVMEVDDLTILTGWAQAVAEALAYAPDRVEPLLAEARGATPWRSKLGIPEPSRQLDDALRSLGRAVRSAASRTKASKLDAVHRLCREPGLAEHRLDTFVRRVLRSAIEQVRTRGIQECCPPSDPISVKMLIKQWDDEV